MAGGEGAHVLETVDFDRVIVGCSGDLAHGVESGMGDAEAGLVLAYTYGGPRVALTGYFPQVPDAEIAVQARGGEEMRVARVEGEAADFLLRELVGFRC